MLTHNRHIGIQDQSTIKKMEQGISGSAATSSKVEDTST
ncbi:unnamed protein product [Larinioides sclopetarius]|uniref:Uncharacterized protein n=1 Tax=Larinioides sclopetarius TaxID=280406 RepID=A0AAV2AX89_9ARAC